MLFICSKQDYKISQYSPHMDIIISLFARFLLMDLVTILSALTTTSFWQFKPQTHIGRLMIELSRCWAGHCDIWPKSIWPKSIWPKYFDQNFFDQIGHLTKKLFDQKIFWPKIHLTKMDIWSKSVWPKEIFDQNLFDQKGHLTKIHLTKEDIWPKSIWPKSISPKYFKMLSWR